MIIFGDVGQKGGIALASGINDGKLKTVSRLLTENSERLGGFHAFVGLDGFVDEIIHIVDTRYDRNNFSRIEKIADFGEKIKRAGGLSCNFELVPAEVRLGGNGPIYANALLSFGLNATYCGALGYPAVHPVFRGMEENPRCKVVSPWQPSHTDALEFSDGKLIMGKITELNHITWESFKEALGGAQGIAEILSRCDLFGMENWTMIPHMSDIWEGIITESFPLIKKPEANLPLAFFDIADPAKRTKEDILRAINLLGRFSEKFRVIFGLNEKETYEIGEALGIDHSGFPPERRLEALAEAVFARMSIYCLVVHPTKEALAVTSGGSFRTVGPYCEKPALTTGAGDNFNAGFCLGQLLGLDVESSLITGVFASGYYVRHAKSAAYDELAEFIGGFGG